MAENGDNKQNVISETGIAWWRDIQIALAALTIIPIRRSNPPTDKEIATAMRAFPIVGLAIGLVAAAVYAAAYNLQLWSLASAILAIGTIVILTGARAEVGVAAFSDALYRKATAKERVADMKTAGLGVHGLLALLFLVTLKIALVAAVANSREAAAALVAAAVGARAILPLATFNLSPLADLDPGPLTVVPTREAAWTTGALGVAFVLLFLGPVAGIAAILFGAVAGAAAAWRMRHELGGYSTEGLAVVLSATEIAVLIAAVVIR